jgi:SAM-dependent methyltransferase
MMVIGAAERTIMNTMVSPIPLEEAACALCGSNDKTLEYTVEDWRYGLPGNFGVVRCRRCGLVYTSPRPTPAAIGVFYPSTYLPHTSLPANPTRPLLHALRQLVFGGRKSVAAALLGFIHNSVTFRGLVWRESFSPRVLDIGCGVGEYLGVWQALGWDIEGVEANEAAAALASSRLSVNIHVSNVEDLQLPEERFDLITMSHCLEHTYSAGPPLAEAGRSAAGDGSELRCHRSPPVRRAVAWVRGASPSLPFRRTIHPTSARATEVSGPDHRCLGTARRFHSECVVPHG